MEIKKSAIKSRAEISHKETGGIHTNFTPLYFVKIKEKLITSVAYVD